MADHLLADPASINRNAHLLIEIAGMLLAGRLDPDAGTLARAPRAHPEVGQKVEEFAAFAQDQYRDLTLLLIALSTKLRTAAHDYVEVDAVAAAALEHILETGRYVAPEDR